MRLEVLKKLFGIVMIMSERINSTTYLDIDGVIFPLSTRAKGFEVPSDAVVIDKNEFYYPDIVRRLGSLSTRLILSSSRGVATLVDKYYKELLEELNVAGVLSINAFEPSNPNYKFDAITGHRDGRNKAFHRRSFDPTPIGTKAVWIDDDAWNISEEKKTFLDNTNFKVIVPDGKIGLTHAHLDSIESFIHT